MKKFLIILSLSLAWVFPAHATDAFDFVGCKSDKGRFTCSYVNPFMKNQKVKGSCDWFRAHNDIEMQRTRFKKYCNPTYSFSVQAKNMTEATAKAKQQLSGGKP